MPPKKKRPPRPGEVCDHTCCRDHDRRLTRIEVMLWTIIGLAGTGALGAWGPRVLEAIAAAGG